jgi:hypothetical protein
MKIKYKKFNSNRKFGVEFELSNNLSKKEIKKIIEQNSYRKVITTRYSLSYRNNYWHVKNDASCGPRGSGGPLGIEIASYICSGLKDVNHVSHVINKVKQNKAEVNKFCGLHVHVDVSDFDEADIGRLLLYWMAIEQVLIYALPFSRWENKYCKFLNPSIKHWVISHLYSSLDAVNIAKFFKPSEDVLSATNSKRSTLNIVNFYNSLHNKTDIRNTVEFRCPEGTVSGKDAKCWIILFVNFVDYVKNKKIFPLNNLSKKRYSVTDMLSFFGLYKQRSFDIYDNNFFNLRKWLLKRIIKNQNSSSSNHYFKQINAKKEAKTLLDRIYKID